MAKYKLISAFHPTAFEKGVYAVSFWKKGETKRLDKNMKFTQVKAKNRADAIRKARIILRI